MHPKQLHILAILIFLLLVAFGIGSWLKSGRAEASLETIEAVITHAPEVPPPVGRSKPARVVVRLEAVELIGELAPDVKYEFWTYNGRVPGPFIRVRVGDQVEVHLKNSEKSKNTHTVDFHAVTGPGGGANHLMVEPGQEAVIRFKALNPGLYIYHCAANPVPVHIANGLYGLILVEPEGGLAPVDREFYVMQSEFYTEEELGTTGLQAQSSTKGMMERPEYIVFNGKVGSLLESGALKAKVGERVRIFFGNIGPNLVSSFHVIGEIFDSVYREGGVTEPEHNIQTTLVPAGSASIVEFTLQVPGDFTLVDHSIFRMMRGALGTLHVEGHDNPDILRKINEKERSKP